ncbi:MAG: extracellular matrix regulatory protein, partial [Bacillota bacterium]|nr:extracellular matrix regulatory protein [Bacillota bacterium]
ATREFMEISRDEGYLTKVGEGEPKALVLTGERGYLTPISSLTLAGRSKSLLAG